MNEGDAVQAVSNRGEFGAYFWIVKSAQKTLSQNNSMEKLWVWAWASSPTFLFYSQRFCSSYRCGDYDRMMFEYVVNLTNESNTANDRLITVLRNVVSDLSYAYVLYWIPEQELSIYEVIVPDRKVAIVELPESGSAEVLVISLSEYKRRNPKLGVERRRKLAAIEKLI